MWPAKILVPVGFALMILQGVSEIIKRFAYLERDSKTWGDVVAKGNIKIDEN